jgi:hypothetical protein
MGLGKVGLFSRGVWLTLADKPVRQTVQMIATMVKNPPEDIKERRTTLIIMPVYITSRAVRDDPDIRQQVTT